MLCSRSAWPHTGFSLVIDATENLTNMPQKATLGFSCFFSYLMFMMRCCMERNSFPTRENGNDIDGVAVVGASAANVFVANNVDDITEENNVETFSDALSVVGAAHNVDFVEQGIIIETWLNADFYDEEYFDTNVYNVYRKDRDFLSTGYSRGGGVLVAIKRSISSRRVSLFDGNLKLDQLIIEIHGERGNIYLCVSYIPPNSYDEFYDAHMLNVIRMAESLKYGDRICLMGDFNLSGLIWSESDGGGFFVPSNVNRAHEMTFIDAVFSLDLCQVNRVFNSIYRMLDLIFVSSDLRFSVSRCDCPISPADTHHVPLVVSIDFYDFVDIGTDSGQRYDYNAFLQSDIVSICYEEFLKALDEVFRNNIPMSRPRVHKLPWYTAGLKRLKNLRNRHYKNFSGCTYDQNLYLHYKREFNFLNKFLYNQYVMSFGDSVKTNPKRFWSFINSRRMSSSLPSVMYYNGDVSESALSCANMFRDFFCSNFSSDDNTFNTDSVVNILQLCDISIFQIEDDDIVYGVNKLSTSYRSDLDGFSAFAIRKCCNSLIEPLKIIFNKSLKIGYFLEKWKFATVIPVYKSGRKDFITNYRPISKFRNFAKVFEHIICRYILFKVKCIINPSQHGFMPDRYHLFGFSKAFDKVPHNLLIYKLSRIGVCYVCISNTCSEQYIQTSGIPQGSVLGPLLFNIFINDIQDCFKYSRHLLYADDLKIFRSIRSLNDVVLLQEDIDRFILWSRLNKLPVNLAKCVHISFHRGISIIMSKYSMDMRTLSTVTEICDLGVVFDVKLNFTRHLDYIIPKAYSLLYFVRRNASEFKDPYASIVWSPSAAIHINRVERVQKSFTKFAMSTINFCDGLPSYESRSTFHNFSYCKVRPFLYPPP
ncbi:uncharacterized protein LOC142235944 [Haematobia irritans]|uniref:uncharacterized protein LOC142235944 n=1 Tax=Haematobia irritans TaxID=7368 RepID=UPI003F4FCC3D